MLRWTPRRRRLLTVGLVAALFAAAACVPQPPRPPKVEAHGSTGQIWATTDPNVAVQLVNKFGDVVPTFSPEGEQLLSRVTDDRGAVIFRYVSPDSGYVVRRLDGAAVAPSDPVRVTGLHQHPPQSFYASQKLNNGYGYLTTRDGHTLAYTVRLPGPPDKGPYPTVIEYSGYTPADPDSPQPSTLIASALGFATVGVNMRGTGCSGGSYQFFEELQSTDGYDIVETVAAQPWALNHKVGMVGISYPGISQLFTAQTQPPSLAAIAPLSVLDDALRSVMYPGGIYNNGFAESFVRDRVRDGKPGGQPWSQQRIDAGDIFCINNQRFRGQNPDMEQVIRDNPTFPFEVGLGPSLAPYYFADDINVPTFLAGAWQDGQTGGRFPNMLKNFTGTAQKKFTLVNGTHVESLAPDVISRWWEFLQFYVARRIPNGDTLRAIAPIIYQELLGTPDPVPASELPVPADRFDGFGSYEAALAAFEAEPQVRVLFDEGAAPGLAPGMPKPGFEASFSQWPIPGVTPTRLYVGSGGTLTPTAPSAPDDAPGTIASYTSDASARPRFSFDGPTEGTWVPLPEYQWTPVVDGKSLSFLTAPFTADTVMAGPASVDLWLRSTAADTDLQVAITEVRPDGQETYVQSGWLRASQRALDDSRSTPLQPIQTHFEDDVAPLPAGEFTLNRVEVYPFTHAFRADSRLRVTLTAPGGDRPFWGFETLPGTPQNEVAHSMGRPSSVVLPVLPGVAVPTDLPPCPSLRGQPCRPYVDPAPQP